MVHLLHRLNGVDAPVRHKIPQTSNLQLAFSSMMSKTAVQKDRLPFQFEGAATSFRGAWAPKPKPSYVPACIMCRQIASPGISLGVANSLHRYRN